MAIRSRRGRRGLGIAVALTALAWPSSAVAQPIMMDDDMAGVALVFIPLGGVVSSAGAQAWIVEGEPSVPWGRVSLGFSAANALVAGVFFIIGAVDDDDDPFPFVLGFIEAGIASSGFVSGITTEVTADEEDPGIPGEPRPPGGTPAMWSFGGTF